MSMEQGYRPRREKSMIICQRCGERGGAWILAHVLLHIVDLIIAAGVAAMVTAATVGKFGWLGIVLGAVMGMGLASFRERGLSRREVQHPSPPSFPLGPPPPAADAVRIQDVGQR